MLNTKNLIKENLQLNLNVYDKYFKIMLHGKVNKL